MLHLIRVYNVNVSKYGFPVRNRLNMPYAAQKSGAGCLVFGLKLTKDFQYLRRIKLFGVIFVCVDSLCPSQQFFSHVGMGLPGLNQY